MALMVETKDCTALSDAEIEEMADLIEDEPVVFDVGELSKQRDPWVLVTPVSYTHLTQQTISSV